MQERGSGRRGAEGERRETLTKEHRRRWSRSIAKSKGERDRREDGRGEGEERQKEKEEEEVCKADRNVAREKERLGWLG